MATYRNLTTANKQIDKLIKEKGELAIELTRTEDQRRYLAQHRDNLQKELRSLQEERTKTNSELWRLQEHNDFKDQRIEAL